MTTSDNPIGTIVISEKLLFLNNFYEIKQFSAIIRKVSSCAIFSCNNIPFFEVEWEVIIKRQLKMGVLSMQSRLFFCHHTFSSKTVSIFAGIGFVNRRDHTLSVWRHNKTCSSPCQQCYSSEKNLRNLVENMQVATFLASSIGLHDQTIFLPRIIAKRWLWRMWPEAFFMFLRSKQKNCPQTDEIDSTIDIKDKLHSKKRYIERKSKFCSLKWCAALGFKCCLQKELTFIIIWHAIVFFTGLFTIERLQKNANTTISPTLLRHSFLKEIETSQQSNSVLDTDKSMRNG